MKNIAACADNTPATAPLVLIIRIPQMRPHPNPLPEGEGASTCSYSLSLRERVGVRAALRNFNSEVV
jgi:hypothetical protein